MGGPVFNLQGLGQNPVPQSQSSLCHFFSQIRRDLAECIENTPEDETEGSAVPQSADCEYGQQVTLFPDGPFSVSAQGDIEIVPKPPGQGQMPSLPEFFYAAGKIGGIEIVQQMDSHHQRRSPCNGGISMKITVNLYREKQQGDHDVKSGPGGGVSQHGIDQNSRSVCDDHF